MHEETALDPVAILEGMHLVEHTLIDPLVDLTVEERIDLSDLLAEIRSDLWYWMLRLSSEEAKKTVFTC